MPVLATAPAVRGDAQLSCASGSSGQRGPAARCLACPAEWRSVQGESPAPRGVESEQAAAFEFVLRATDSAEARGWCNVRVQTSL